MNADNGKAHPAFRRLVVLAVVTLAVGCAKQVSGSARAEPPLHVFPDLTNYTEDRRSPFDVPLRGNPSLQFITPTGVQCQITPGALGCTGPFSSDPYTRDDKVCSALFPTDQAKPDRPNTYSINVVEEKCPASTTPQDQLLKDGYKVTADWGSGLAARFVCAVGPPDRLACIDEIHRHGFVIEPSGAWTF